LSPDHQPFGSGWGDLNNPYFGAFPGDGRA